MSLTSTATDASLVSIRVGRPRTIDDPHPWRTAFLKDAVTGPVWLRATNLDGDRQADLRVHGGVDKAVCVYSGDHYPAWRIELERPDMTSGGFGENFTVNGQTEQQVCVGDRFRIGAAVVEVLSREVRASSSPGAGIVQIYPSSSSRPDAPAGICA